MDPLQDVVEDDIPKLLEILKKDWPLSLHVYSFIRNHLKWKKKNSSKVLLVLCPGGDFSDGSVVCIAPMQVRVHIVVYCCVSQDCRRLGEALKYTKKLDWNQYLFFESLMQPHVTLVEDALMANSAEKLCDNFFDYKMWLPSCQHNIQFECPNDVKLVPLERRHVQQIDSRWVHHQKGSAEFLTDTIENNLGIGLCVGNELVCWALHTHYGGIGVLYTEERHRNKGYAQLVVKTLCRRMLEEGVVPHVCIRNTNLQSKSLFDKLGFQVISMVWFVIVKGQ